MKNSMNALFRMANSNQNRKKPVKRLIDNMPFNYDTETWKHANKIAENAIIRFIQNNDWEYAKTWLDVHGFGLNIPTSAVKVTGYTPTVSGKTLDVFTQGQPYGGDILSGKASVFVRLEAADCGAEKTFPTVDINGNIVNEETTTGKVKWAAFASVPIPLWKLNIATDTTYAMESGGLFTPDEIDMLCNLFKRLIYSYHMTSFLYYNHVGDLNLDGIIVGIEPEIMFKRNVYIATYNGVPLNRQGMLATALFKMKALSPMLTLDSTVDLEILIKPIADLRGFRDWFCCLSELFYMQSSESGTHIHASKVKHGRFGESLVWNVYNDNTLIALAKRLFTAFIGYLESGAESTKEIRRLFGRTWGSWCANYVGTENHGCAINITNGHIEYRLCKYLNEAQYLKLVQMVSDFSNIFDKLLQVNAQLESMYSTDYASAQYHVAANVEYIKAVDTAIDTANDMLKAVWLQYVKNESATDTNSVVETEHGTRKRNGKRKTGNK